MLSSQALCRATAGVFVPLTAALARDLPDHSFFGHPFIVDGRELPPESHNLYEFDIGFYNTWNSI